MDQTLVSSSNVRVKVLVGVLCALGTICIWASWISVTRLGVITSLSVSDITFLRFGVAGILLFPVIMKRGFDFKKLGAIQFIIIVSGAGASYTLVAALIAIPVLNEWPTYIDWIGIFVVTLGVYLASGSRLRRVN